VNKNKCILIGRMGGAPTMRYTGTGKAVTRFSLAVNSGRGENQQTDWFTVETWEQRAEFVNQYGDKGRLVYVEGHVTLDRYESKEGEPRAEIKVKAFDVTFLDPRNGNGSGANGGASDAVDDLDF
jgi:single-strand DNA-binding protein